MTIASAIQAKQQQVADSYTAVSNKGGTLPTTQNLTNLPTAINSINTVNNTTLSITPTTSVQNFTPSSPYTGYESVSVSAVTNSIDANIVGSNIISGVSILGVSGTATVLKGEIRSVSITSTEGNTFRPTEGKNGIVIIEVFPTNEARTITPTTSQQSITVNNGYSGNGTITVEPVTSSIDSNITAGNIKKDVTILGVTGTYEGSGSATLITKSITSNGTYNASSDNADGYSSVTVNVSGGGSSSAPIFDGNYFVDSNGSITNLIQFTADSGSSRKLFLKPFATSFANNSNVKNWLNEDSTECQDSIVSIKKILQIAKITYGNFVYNVSYDATVEYISFRAIEEAIFSGSKQFQGFTSLKKVDLHNAKKVSMQAAFSGLSRFEAIDLSSLEDLTTSMALGGAVTTGGAFANTSIEELYLPALKSTSFGSYTNQFNYMLKGVTGCTVHFPSNLQSVIGSWSSVTSGFGGTNTTILFDLTATT